MSGQSHKKCETANSSGEERKEPEQAATTNIICNDNCNQRCKKAQQSEGGSVLKIDPHLLKI